MADEEPDDMARELYEAGRAALQANDLETAIRQLEESIAQYPHFRALELLGEAWLKKGEPQKALVPLAAAATLNGQVRAPSLLAEALLALGNEVEAYRIAQLALSRDASNKKAQAVADATRAAHQAWTVL